MTEEQNEAKEIITDHYELLYIMPMSYTAEELKPINDKVVSIIKDNQGNITKEEDLGKLKFAYPIKHQSHGYYQLYEFDMPKENLKRVNKACVFIEKRNGLYYCKIHKFKPAVCRKWPFSGFFKKRFIYAKIFNCPGLARINKLKHL